MPLVGVRLGIGFGSPHLVVIVFNYANKGGEVLASSLAITLELIAMTVATAIAGIVVNNTRIIFTDRFRGRKF